MHKGEIAARYQSPERQAAQGRAQHHAEHQGWQQASFAFAAVLPHAEQGRRQHQHGHHGQTIARAEGEHHQGRHDKATGAQATAGEPHQKGGAEGEQQGQPGQGLGEKRLQHSDA